MPISVIFKLILLLRQLGGLRQKGAASNMTAINSCLPYRPFTEFRIRSQIVVWSLQLLVGLLLIREEFPACFYEKKKIEDLAHGSSGSIRALFVCYVFNDVVNFGIRVNLRSTNKVSFLNAANYNEAENRILSAS